MSRSRERTQRIQQIAQDLRFAVSMKAIFGNRSEFQHRFDSEPYSG